MLKVQTIMHQVGERESHPDCVGVQIVENGFVQFSLVLAASFKEGNCFVDFKPLFGVPTFVQMR
jgi:hypothetical protein